MRMGWVGQGRRVGMGFARRLLDDKTNTRFFNE
jgi:hypothetical protein